MYMAQINININEEFEQNLLRIMEARGYRHRSEAIRAVVAEAARRCARPQSIARLRGLAAGGPQNPRPRFRDHAELWNDADGD